MICDLCGQSGAQVRRVARSYGKGETLFVIENVPLVSCPHCGESYFTAKNAARDRAHQGPPTCVG